MKIEASQIDMRYGHLFRKRDFEAEALKVSSSSPSASTSSLEVSNVDIYSRSGSLEVKNFSRAEITGKSQKKKNISDELGDAFKKNQIRVRIDAARKVITSEFLKVFADNIDEFSSSSAPNVTTEHYRYSEEHFEGEKIKFETRGYVRTADGKELSIDLSFSMSRSFYSKFDINRIHRYTTDPLTINFEGSSAELSSVKFAFDLDADGMPDQISQLTNGSGFIALDKNNNGKIDDGTELFGPSSGDGFLELSKFDSDKNGWIDENDEIFDSLRIWVKDENGRDELFALGEKGVGAICLKNIDTQFSFKDDTQNTLGFLRKSGLFLFEDGKAGTVQHVDLTV